MPTNSTRLTTAERRRALRWGIINGSLWSAGNGLTTGASIVYLAQELGAQGLEVAQILALQSLVGVLRLAAPALIARLGGAKRGTIVPLLASYILLCALPLLMLPGVANRLQWLMGLLCVHQLLESLGTVALWTWLARLVPPRLRGRYFATRQRWQLTMLIPMLLAAGWFADWWRSPARQFASSDTLLYGYTVPIGLGALALLLSIWPLTRMPEVESDDPAGDRATGFSLAPLFDGRFQRLLLFAAWTSFVNGLTQSASSIYPRRVLKLGLLPMLLLPAGMRIGQIALAPWAGKFSDRFGNRPTMVLCQAAVALGPLFFLLSSVEQPYWLGGAFFAWSAYVGLNICLPNLTLKLTQNGQYAAYTATYFAVSGLAYGVSTLLGGWLLDLFWGETFWMNDRPMDNFSYLFYIGFVTRLLAVLLILGIDEPGAKSLRDIFDRLRGRSKSATLPTHV